MYGRAGQKVIDIIEDKTNLRFGFYVVRFYCGKDGRFNAVFNWYFDGEENFEWLNDWYEGQKDVYIDAIWNVGDMQLNDDNEPLYSSNYSYNDYNKI